jgi:hypothetical protein
MLETKLLFRMKAKDGNLDALNVSNFMRTNRQRKTANFIIGDAQLKKYELLPLASSIQKLLVRKMEFPHLIDANLAKYALKKYALTYI